MKKWFLREETMSMREPRHKEILLVGNKERRYVIGQKILCRNYPLKI
jgi:hypothetical protein